jgi:hypothetical protein
MEKEKKRKKKIKLQEVFPVPFEIANLFCLFPFKKYNTTIKRP